MAQPPLPPSNGSSIPPRRPVPQQTGGPHSHGQVNHPQYSHSNHGHSHSSNLPLLRTSNHNHGHIHSELDSSSLSSSRFNIDWEAKEVTSTFSTNYLRTNLILLFLSPERVRGGKSKSSSNGEDYALVV